MKKTETCRQSAEKRSRTAEYRKPAEHKTAENRIPAEGGRKSSEKNSTRSIGTVYEELAAAYLEEKGYRILERNYGNRYGEIDLIALCPPESSSFPERGTYDLLLYPGAVLVICEVKYRTHRGTGDPAEAVTTGKMRHICRAAVGYYMEQRLSDTFPCRFDVISILGNGEVRHIEDAFPFTV